MTTNQQNCPKCQAKWNKDLYWTILTAGASLVTGQRDNRKNRFGPERNSPKKSKYQSVLFDARAADILSRLLGRILKRVDANFNARILRIQLVLLETTHPATSLFDHGSGTSLSKPFSDTLISGLSAIEIRDTIRTLMLGILRESSIPAS